MEDSYRVKKLIEQETYKLIKRGFDIEEIKGILKNNDSLRGRDDLISVCVTVICNDYADYKLIQKIKRSKLIQDIEGSHDDFWLIDPLCKIPQPITRQVIKSVLAPKYDLTPQIYTCKFTYEPLRHEMLFKDSDGLWVYNTYIPPEWLKDAFYSEGSVRVPKRDTIPPIYEQFFYHIVNNNQDSYNYLVEWLANGVQSRNYCILTTIGEQGIGKGVLGDIMRLLFGGKNYHQGSGTRILSGHFNGQIRNKRLVYIDEIKIDNQRMEDQIKMFVNEYIEVEAKGIDAVEIRNFANLYVSSNNMDSLKISGDDRRFSILDLTTTKLLKVYSPAEIEALLDLKNIEQLAHYLYYKPVDKVYVSTTLKSKQLIEVRESSQNEWEEWFLNQYLHDHMNETLTLTEVSAAIERQMNFSIRPGRPALLNLQKRFPEYFKLKCILDDNKRRKWVIIVEDRSDVCQTLN